MRSYHQPHITSCTSVSPVMHMNYPGRMCSSGNQRKNSSQLIYHNMSSLSYQMDISSSSLSHLSTPKKVPPEVPKRTSSISFKSNESGQMLLSNSEMEFEKTRYSGSLSSVQSSSSDSSSTVNASHSSSLNVPNYLSPVNTSWNRKPPVSV